MLNSILNTTDHRRLAKESLWALLGQLLSAVTGLVTVRILTEMVATGEYGKANLLLGLLTLCMNVAVAPVTLAQLRLFPDYRIKGEEGAFLKVVRRRVLIGAFLVAAALCIGLPFVKPLIGTSVNYIETGVLCLLALVTALKAVSINRLNSERKQIAQSVWSGIEPLVILILTVPALYVAATASSLMAGQLLGSLALLLYFALREKPDKAHRVEATPAQSRELRGQLSAYGRPFIVIAVLNWLGSLGDRYVLGSLLGAAEVGIYAASFGLASRPILLVSGVINQVLRPVLFEASSAKDLKTHRRVTIYWFLLVGSAGVASAALLALFGNLLASVFLAKTFRSDAGAIMAWIALGYAFFTLGQAIENQLMANYKSGLLIVPQLVGGLSNVGIALYLVPINGVIGAAQANAASFVLQTAVVFWMWLRVRANSSLPGSSCQGALP